MDVIYTPQHARHITEGLIVDGSPWVLEEIPARAESIRAALQAAGMELHLPEDYSLEPILAVHTTDFVRYLQTAYERGVAETGTDDPFLPWTFATRGAGPPPPTLWAQRGYYAFSTDVPIGAGTWTAAYWSAQCALTATTRVLAGAPAAYALCRPPGHHAAADLYGGFCYLNNAAIAARALHTHTNQRVLVLDIDFHHGNGTQAIFYEDPLIAYVSLHGDPDAYFPYYWGRANERGVGGGYGTNLNLPLRPPVDDIRYLATLATALDFIHTFAPGYLVISAGFDAAAGDPIGEFAITQTGFGEIGARIAALGIPTVIVQEGGYDVERLGDYARALLSAWDVP